MSSDHIRHEADRLLASGLRQILSEHGDVHVIGSYALNLMTWRDLDIHRGFTSSNIYSAVLDRGVRDADAFWADLETSTGIRR